MSPIFVRPVREQLEHDRLTRFLLAKYKRKFDVVANVGDEQGMPVKIGPSSYFPDLVLTSGRKLAGLVEVESGESVNNLEAMAQWVPFSKVRVPFHLYVPMQAFDAARRFCEAHHARVAEIWTYRATNDGFDLVRMFHDSGAGTGRAPAAPVAVKKPEPVIPVTKPVATAKPVAAAAKPVATAKPAAAKPVAAKPVAAKPVAAKPVAAKPLAAKPAPAGKPTAKPASKPPAAAKAAVARKPAKPAPPKKAKPGKAKSGKR